MNRYNKYIFLNLILYFIYCEVKHFFRFFKHYFNLFLYVNFFKYFLHRKKDFNVINNTTAKRILKKNYNFWKKFVKQNNSNNEILITSLVSLNAYSIYNCIIGLIISKNYSKNISGLIKEYDFKTEIFMRSFGIEKIYYIPEGNFFSRFIFLLKSIKLTKNIKKIEDFLNLKYENIDIGRVAYDHWIRFTGIGSADFISPKIVYFLSKALLVQNFSKELFESNSFKEVVQTESQFIPSAIIFQNSLINNCNVYARIGISNKISVMIYNDLKNMYTDRYHFSKNLFELIYNNYQNKIFVKTDEIMKKRFLNFKEYASDHNIEERMEHKFDVQENLNNNYSKKDLCNKFDWDTDKPIVVLFSNDLTDGVFKFDWKIFKDNLTGIRETLNIIKEIEHINWLVKPHPNDIKNNVVTSVETEVVKLSKFYKNIKLFPKNFGNSPIPKIISAAITMGGSVGYEYPSFGIPAIICMGTYYAGYGFNCEPSTVDEYKKMLKKADKLGPLSKEQILKAKIFIYIYSVLAKVYTPLVPSKGTKITNYEEISFFNDLETLLENYELKKDDFYNNFKIQLEKSDRHTINYNLIE